MATRLNFQDLVRSLKVILRARKITYRELAQRTGIPESTLKKNLTSDDGSFNRISEICSAIDLSIEDLFDALEDENPKQVHFTAAQAEYFLSDADCFRFYWHLVYERKSVLEIMDLYNLTKRQASKYLNKLDKLSLIELHAGDRVKIPKLKPVQWIRKDRFTDKLFKEWSQALLHEAASVSEGDESYYMRLQMYQLRAESAADLVQALKEVDEEFSRRTIREMSINKDNLNPIRVSMIVAPGSFIVPPTKTP